MILVSWYIDFYFYCYWPISFQLPCENYVMEKPVGTITDGRKKEIGVRDFMVSSKAYRLKTKFPTYS